MVTDWLKRLRQHWWRGSPRVRTSRRHGGTTIAARVQSLEPRVLLSATPLGTAFQVNSFTTSAQRSATIAMDADGDFVVVWHSDGQDGSGYGVFAQRYNAAGVAQEREFRVNTYTTGNQFSPSVALDADGDFVVTWFSFGQDGSSNGVFAQRYNAAGVPQGSEFRVNTYTTGSQIGPRVAMDADGDFVIAWQSFSQDGSGYGVFAQRYNAAGVAQGSEFQVNTFTTGIQRDPRVAKDADGDFVVTWESAGQDGSSFGIFAQRYNAAGVPQGGEFRVNTYTTFNQNRHSVAMDADGDFVVTWSSNGQDGSSYGVFAQQYNAAGVAQGSEFQVNTYTTSNQFAPSVAMDGDGDFVIAWQSFGQDGSGYYGIFAQRYTAAGVLMGSEFRVTTFTTDTQRDPCVALDGDGDFVIAWGSFGQDGSSFGIYAQRYSSVIPVETEFRVNTYTTGGQRYSAVAIDDDGDFVVVWQSNGQETTGITSDYSIFAQRYNAEGVAQGSEFRVNTYTTNNQSIPSLAMRTNGDFVIAWQSPGQDGSGYGIYAQRYNAAGVAQGSEFRVNTYTTGNQLTPSVAMDADGDFVVAWTSAFQDGSDYGVFAQRYNAAGVAQGAEFQVNLYTTGRQSAPSVAMDADGNLVVTWESSGQDGSGYGILAQRYNAAGVAQGAEFQVNLYTTGGQSAPTVAMDADGNFVVAWSSSGQDGSGYGIFAQRYNAAGIEQGREFRVNTYTTSFQSFPAVAMDADGDFVIAWNSYGQDGSFYGVIAQRYNAAGVTRGSEFQVNTYTNGAQWFAAVALDAGGNFVVTWTSAFQDGSDDGVYAKRFTANQLPVINPQVFAIAENRPIGHVVGTVVASDPDVGQTLTYAITGGDPNGQFAINATTGQITVAKATINFEATPQFQLTVQVTDNSTPKPASRSATITVNILDLNEAPMFLAPTTFAIAENRPIGFFVGDVNTSDQEGHTVTYSIVGGDPNAQFAINASTGVLTVAKATINFEATPQFVLQVKAQDNGSPANSRTQGITVNILDLNEAPTFLPPTTFSISENRPIGQFVGDVNTSDPEGHTVTYSIVGGDPNAQFAINASTGVITVAKATINYEATPQFLLQVKAQDNGSPANSRTQTITVNIVDLNEAPTFLTPTTFTISENRPVGQFVGDVNTSDPEGHTVTYSIVGGDPNAQFAINAATGVITVAKATINFEATPQFLLSVKAQDNGSPANSRTQTVTVNIVDLNEAPVFLAPTTFSLPENSPNGTVVGTVNTFDQEGHTVTYAITAGNTNNAFAIHANTGQITVANTAALDFETTPQFLLSVKAQDNGSPSNSRTQTITINLTDLVGAGTRRSAETSDTTLAAATTLASQSLTPRRTADAVPVPTADKPPAAVYSFLLQAPPPRDKATSTIE